MKQADKDKLLRFAIQTVGAIVGAFFFIWLFSSSGSGAEESKAHGKPTPTPAPAPSYPKGAWASFGDSNQIPDGLVANKGIVGIGVTQDWDKIETSDGVYDWSALDNKIAIAKTAGFKNIALGITWSTFDTPAWLVTELKAAGKTIPLLDPGSNHSTYCQAIDTPLYWNPRFHAKRLALIAAAGAHYSGDPAIVATFASAFNHNSLDWNIQDTVGVLTSCPNGIPDQTVDQVQQWLDAGWTEARVLQVGEEIADAVAAAFPNQCIKLPIGGLNDKLADDPPGSGNGTYTTLARNMVAYVATRPYANRFYIQRNTVDANFGTAQSLIDKLPGFGSERYIKLMIANAAPLSGLQTVSSATICNCDGVTPCRQNGNNPCTDNAQVMLDTLNVMLTYKTSFIEVWPQDAQNQAFYNMIANTTITMGGQLRL